MATPDEIQQQLAGRRPNVTPVGDVPAATARATTPSPMSVPPTTPAATAATPAAATAPLRGLPRPPDFIGDASGNVVRNTPSAGWTTTPGAGGPTPLGNAASRLTSPAPNWTTGAGATGTDFVNPPAATRAATVAPSPTGGNTLGLVQPPAPQPLTLEPKTLAMESIDKPSAAPAAPVGEDISSQFAKRAAASRAGVDAGGAPRTLTPGQINAANDAIKAGTASPAAAAEAAATPAAAPSLAQRAGAAVRGASEVAGNVARLGAAPVETAPGRLGLSKTAPGQGGGSAALLATMGIGSALGSLNRPTEAYRERLGMDPQGGAVGDAFARTAGVLSDLGATILDAPTDLLNATGLTSIRPVASRFNDRTNDFQPNYATDKGFFSSPSSGKLSEADKAANQQWETGQLAQALAARTGQPAPTEAGNPTAAPTPTATTTTAAPAPTSASARLASAPPATANGSAAVAAPAMTPDQAMASNAPGTAVINGRVVGADEIARLANRNVVPSTAFTNPGVGNLFSAATGGGTPTSDQAMALAAGLATPSASRLTAPVGTSGAGLGGPQQLNGRARTINDLMGKISSALQSGRRRTAKVLVDQLATFDRASNSDNELALREREFERGRLPTPQTAGQIALQAAETDRASSEAQVAKINAAQRQQAAAIQQELLTETNPEKRKTLQQNLLSLAGKQPESSVDRLINLKVPVGQGLDQRNLELPYDPLTNELRIPNGYAQLIGLMGGQPQAKPK